MKKLIVVICILVLILAFGIYDHVRVKNVFDELTFRINELDRLVDEKKTAEALDACTALIEWWEKERIYVEMFDYSTEMRQIPVTLGEIEGSLEVDDLQNASSKTASTIILIENVRKTVSFDLIGLM
ncbi:MAG: DUF4363 family protein [Faecalibacterium sp.]|nr:DUF4363 family protein [Faecalibacterium sp.]MDY3255777.1 DUF4363 family protein [Eubacteriales bacterium]